jgi:hypothetical protein
LRVKPDIIALLSDLGNKDFFTGAMKGAIMSVNPNAKIVDITHEIPKFDPRVASFILLQAARSFPPQTVFVVVVDPGVGTQRKCLLLKARNGMCFIAPDNGVLTSVANEFGIERVWEIKNRALIAPRISRTFHGRDVMAPVAAHLTLGVSPSEVGPPVSEIELLGIRQPKLESGYIIGEIVHVDNFGNIISSIPETMVNLIPGERVRIRVAGKAIYTLFGATFADVPEGEYVCYIGSAGMLELAKNQRSAARELNVKIGDEFLVMGK